MAHKGSRKRHFSTDDDEEEHVPSKRTPASKHPHGANGMRSPSFSFTPHNKPAELYRKDLISAMKLADSEQLQTEDYLLIADPWRQDWEKGVQVPVNDLAILNEPKVKEIREKCKSGDFKIPRKFLHAQQDETFRQGCHELTGMNQLSEQVVRYDLDDLDVSWLESVNNEREELSLPLIHEWTMERIMEELENQCHKGMNAIIKNEEGLGIEYDENVVCDVCRSPDSEDGNEMVFCDNCDVCVHQACYGIQKIPEGSYLCRACALSIKPSCLLCPNLKGAMKSTRSGTKWAHVSCAIWIPEVSIGCVEKMEPITKISLIPASRWALLCCLCKERSGACIQCSVKTCKTAFHVTCGFNHNMDMKTILDPAEKDGVKLRAFCPKHTKNGGESGCDSPSSPNSPRSPRKDGSITPRKDLTKEEIANLRAKKLKEIEEDFITFVDITEAANNLQVDVDTINIVAVYWKLKRKANFDTPLLMPKTEEADRLEKQQEDSLVARMKMFVHLRQDLERVRNLCYMVNRREKMKRQFVKVQEKVFLATNAYITNPKLNLSSREVQKQVKKYKDFNVYLARNIKPLPNLPPTLTHCSDFDSVTTDDDRSEHSGPVYSKRFKIRRLSGLEKLDTDPLPSVSAKTEFSDNDVDIEADEPPVLEMEDISARRPDFAKATSAKEGNESKNKDPMPNLLPELDSSPIDIDTPKSSKTISVTENNVVSKLSIKNSKPDSTKSSEDILIKPNSEKWKSTSGQEKVSDSRNRNLKSFEKKLKLELKKLSGTNYSSSYGKSNTSYVEDKKEDSATKLIAEKETKQEPLKSEEHTHKSTRKKYKTKLKEIRSQSPNTNFETIDVISKNVKEAVDILPSCSVTIEKSPLHVPDLESKESKPLSLKISRTPEIKVKKVKEESAETKNNSAKKIKERSKSSTSVKKGNNSAKVSTRSRNGTSDMNNGKRPSKHILNGLLTKPNLRINDDIKNKVQNTILKTRAKLKRLNGVMDNLQPKINAFFIVNNSSANSEIRYTNGRNNLNHLTPVKKACEADSHGSSSNPKGGSLSDSKHQNSPLRDRTEPVNHFVDEDISWTLSPETRSIRKRVESSSDPANSVRKDIFKASPMSRLTASDNYSAIPILGTSDCLSLKKSLKETVNNSCAYRSHSPSSSGGSSLNDQEVPSSTLRRSARCRNIDNDENSHDSTSSRSSARFKVT